MDKLKRLKKVMFNVEKKYGTGVVQMASDIPKNVIRIPSGNFATDIEIGGGIPIGRWGSIRSIKESEGKTNWCIHQVRQFTDRKIPVIWVDGENCFEGNVQHFKDAGIDLDYLVVVYGEKAEIMGEVALEMIKEGVVGAMFLDSTQSLLMDIEDDKDLDKGQGNAGMKQANFMASMVRRLVFHSRKRMIVNASDEVQLKRNCVTLFSIDRLTPDIKMSGFSPLPSFKATGGQHKENAYSWRLVLSKGEWLKKGTGEYRKDWGQVNKFKYDKNKTFARNRIGTYDLYFDNKDLFVPGQIDNLKSVVKAGLKYDILIKKGGWIHYIGKDIKFNGEDRLNTLKIQDICDIMIDIVRIVNPKCIFYDDVSNIEGKKSFFYSYFPKCYNWNFTSAYKKKNKLRGIK